MCKNLRKRGLQREVSHPALTCARDGQGTRLYGELCGSVALSMVTSCGYICRGIASKPTNKME